MATKICLHCKLKKQIKARGLCSDCYYKLTYSGELKKYPKSIHKVICKRCKKLKKYYARGLCKVCYSNETQIKISSGTMYVPLGTKKELSKYKKEKEKEFLDSVLKDVNEFMKKC